MKAYYNPFHIKIYIFFLARRLNKSKSAQIFLKCVYYCHVIPHYNEMTDRRVKAAGPNLPVVDNPNFQRLKPSIKDEKEEGEKK